MHKNIAMWSGPRNLSTALMRSFGNRPDCYVTDEPFYAYYLKHSNINHPMKKKIILNGNTNLKSIIDHITGSVPENKLIWYQKHMAQHNILDFDLNWIHKLQNCFLIRNPKDVIISYETKYPLTSYLQLGYQHQIDLCNILNNISEYIIIDSDDLLINPKHILKLLCDKLNIVFYNEMLLWPRGSKPYDGIWGKHWYNQVNKSDKFISKKNTKKILPLKYNDIYYQCLDCYQQLYEQRLK